MSGPARDVVIPADIRFPLERANGVQIVKTAAALGRAGARTTLVVRHTDPRPTPEILRLYGVEEATNLCVRRLRVRHRPGSFLLPRATFLARAGGACAAGLRRGAVVLTRDLQLADWLLRVFPRGRIGYEAHAVECILYGERGALYGTHEAPRDDKAERLRAREGRVWRRAALVVTTTRGIRDSFVEMFGPRDRVAVVPNGGDVPAVRPRPAREGAPRVVYAGQLYPWKGVDVLVEAMTRVPAARLAIVGGIAGEPDLVRVRGLVERLGLSGRVEMEGQIPQREVASALARADVVAVPFLRSAMTERHTSPIKAFEALAAGRPIVASDLPSTREVLRHGENAWLVPPGDPAALGDAIRRLLDDRALAERLADAAFQDAPAYSWDARAKAILSALGEVA